jgi:hypothetical protein
MSGLEVHPVASHTVRTWWNRQEGSISAEPDKKRISNPKHNLLIDTDLISRQYRLFAHAGQDSDPLEAVHHPKITCRVLCGSIDFKINELGKFIARAMQIFAWVFLVERIA